MDAAIVGALATIILPRVITYIGSRSSKDREMNTAHRVGSIRSELEAIHAAIGGPRWGRKKSSLHRTALIARVRRLAADMEYSMDLFLMKTTPPSLFAKEIDKFQERSKDVSDSLKSYIDNEPEEVPQTANRAYNAEEDLLFLLLGSQSEIESKVISVMGFGGQNTDFTTRVYKNDEVEEHFSQRVRVTAVNKSLEDVLTEILGELKSSPSTSDVKQQLESCVSKESPVDKSVEDVPTELGRLPPPYDLKHQLESRLSKKKYLIVIDDVRTRELFNGLSSFPWANKVGGRIVVTTNIQPVVRACICGNAVPPPVPDSSTAGLVLVGMVCRMSYEETCFTLLDAAVARMEGFVGSDYEKVVLEDCLLYFSMFPHGLNVSRNSLIRRYLAEGILDTARKNLAQYATVPEEEIVGKHLDILIDHNMIQSIKKRNNGKVKRCQPPGIVFNHICSKAPMENFFTLCGTNQPNTGNEDYVRRLSLHPYYDSLNVPDVRHLLTMVVFPAAGAKYESILTFEKHRLLRVLDLKKCADLKACHVEKICDVLLMLKYLSLGNSIDSVPRIICQLIWLETLDMRTSNVVTLYTEVLMLPKLKHLLGKFQLAQEGLVMKVFRDKKKLTEFLRNKSVLETLAGIFVGNGKGLPELLRHMHRLRKVKIWCDSTTQESTDLTDLKKGIKEFTSNQIRVPEVDYSLSIDFNGSSQLFKYCLEDAGRITSLKLCGNVTQLSPPVKGALPICIQELCLSGTNLSGADLHQGLSTLTCQLRFLKLVEENLEGVVIKNNDPFKKLERLCLVGVQSLRGIIIQDLSMLFSLHLLCRNLGDLPDICIGSLGNLQELGLHSRVAVEIQVKWECAATRHLRQPKVVSIERD